LLGTRVMRPGAPNSPRPLREFLPIWHLLPIFVAAVCLACVSVPDDAPEKLLVDGKKLLEEDRAGRSRHWFRKIRGEHASSQSAEEAAYLLAVAYSRTESSTSALAAYKKFAQEYPNSRFSVEAAQAQYEFGLEHLRGGVGGWFIFGANYDTGVDLLEHMQIAYHNHSLADDALVHVANYQMTENRYLEAQATCQRILREYPRRENTAYARFLLARSLWRFNQGPDYDERLLLRSLQTHKDFIATVEEDPALTRKHAKRLEIARTGVTEVTERLALKQVRIAEFYERRDQPGSAEFYYRYCMREYPETSAAKEAQGRLAILANAPKDDGTPAAKEPDPS